MPDFPISGPLGVFLMLLLSGFGAPFPEELVLAGGGLAAHPHRETLAFTILVGWLGVLAADSVLYGLGRFFGGNVLRHRWMARHLSPEKLARFEKYLAARGPKIILVLRFMTGLRAPAYFSAGAMRFPYGTFLLMDGFAALVSVPAFCILGFTMGKHIALIKQGMEAFGLYVAIGVFAAILAFIAYRWWRGEQSEVEP